MSQYIPELKHFKTVQSSLSRLFKGQYRMNYREVSFSCYRLEQLMDKEEFEWTGYGLRVEDEPDEAARVLTTSMFHLCVDSNYQGYPGRLEMLNTFKAEWAQAPPSTPLECPVSLAKGLHCIEYQIEGYSTSLDTDHQVLTELIHRLNGAIISCTKEYINAPWSIR